MISNNTAEGLSFSSMINELLLGVMTIGYNLHYQYPVSAYAENIAIIIQNFFILYLSWKFGQVKDNNFFGGSVVILTALTLYLTDRMPEEVYLYNQLLIAIMCTLISPRSGL